MPGGYETDSVTCLETNLDDCAPEILGAAMEKLLAAGALDVWFTPIQMKKHRPAVMLSVMCEESAAGELADLIFRETTAFGLRRHEVTRLKRVSIGGLELGSLMPGDWQEISQAKILAALAKSPRHPG